MTNRDVIIACDFSSAEETFRFLDLFKNEARKPFLKIGMELFYAEEGYIKPEDRQRLIAFRNNPSDESWINK